MKRAVIYARVSTDMQRGNYSIPTQVDECWTYLQENGYSLVGDQYVDHETGYSVLSGNGAIPAYVDDYSSRELSRPSLDAAIDYLQKVGYDVLVVHSLDRLARDPYIRESLERELYACGAKVEYVLGNYDETPEGEVRKDLDATFAKWENAKRVERCNRGKKRKAENGNFVAGRVPFGYYQDENALGGLAVDEEQAEIVRYIFDLYVNEGESIRCIVDTLTEKKIKTYSGNTKWAHSTVRRILKNSAYKGVIYYNRRKREGKRNVMRPRSEWTAIKITPIIDEWTYSKAQTRFAENKKLIRRRPKRFYLLGGMVVCEKCGRPYLSQTAKAGKNRRKNDAQFYRHRKKDGHCINRSVSARILEPQVWNEIRNVMLDPQRLIMGYEDAKAQQEQALARHRAHLEILRERLGKLDKQRDNLNELYLDPDMEFTKDEYIEQKNRIDAEVRGIAEDIEEAEMELAKLPVPMDLATLEVFAEKIRARFAENYDPQPKDKRELLEMLHVKVIIKLDGGVKVDGWFGDKRDGLLTRSSIDYVLRRQLPPKHA